MDINTQGLAVAKKVRDLANRRFNYLVAYVGDHGEYDEAMHELSSYGQAVARWRERGCPEEAGYITHGSNNIVWKLKDALFEEFKLPILLEGTANLKATPFDAE